MNIQDVLIETARGTGPGYAAAARDCLRQADPNQPTPADEQWLAAAQVFATLAVVVALDDLSRWYQETNP